MKIYTQKEMDEHNANFNKQILMYEKQIKAADNKVNALAGKIDDRNWVIFGLSVACFVLLILCVK